MTGLSDSSPCRPSLRSAGRRWWCRLPPKSSCTTIWPASAPRWRTSVPAFREATGRTVLSRATAEKVGEVGQFVVDGPGSRIAALAVGKGRKARVVDWSAVTGFGPDAMMIESEAALRDPAADELKHDWLGRRLLTDRGFEVGSVRDVEFDGESGELQSLVADVGDPIAADRVRGAGSFAIVVAAG